MHEVGVALHDLSLVIRISSPSRLFCEGLTRLLAHHVPKSLVQTPWAALDQDTEPPGCPEVLMIDGGGALTQTIADIRASRAARPNALILVLDLANHVDDVVACIEAGAGAYTVRGAGVDVLVEGLRMLCLGQATSSPEVTARVFARLAAARCDGAADEGGIRLTGREREILQYLAADYSNQQIADLLVIEVRTVKYHVHNILAKLRARHRWQAVSVAHAQGLIDQQGE
jgi:DNA-binding NarL/FixJ family response regulator